MLHVCKESREEALRFYKLEFGLGLHSAAVYFDFNQDTICFGPLQYQERKEVNAILGGGRFLGAGDFELEHFMEHVDFQTLRQIRHLAIYTCCHPPASDFQPQRWQLDSMLLQLPQLKELVEIYTANDLDNIYFDRWPDMALNDECCPPELFKEEWKEMFEALEDEYPTWRRPTIIMEYDTQYNSWYSPERRRKAKYVDDEEEISDDGDQGGDAGGIDGEGDEGTKAAVAVESEECDTGRQ